MARHLRFLALVLYSTHFFPATPLAQESLREQLEALPGAQVEKIKTPRTFEEAYRILLPQPVEHEHPERARFEQRIYLSHRGFERPVVLDTEGYAAKRNTVKELSGLLQSNQIIVEHRYFGRSKPDPLEWRFLTVKQAAADHHRVIELFKVIYPGKWLSTGISKGGQTALAHRRYYPDDVDATFAYVAPINRALEDPRIDRFFAHVGDAPTRKAIERFQILLLEKRKELMPLLREHSRKKKYEYERLGEDVVFEYGVLEYPFSFWQWKRAPAKDIPGQDAPLDEILAHFVKVVSFYYYSDKGLDYISTFFYQSSNELGYYGYLTEHLEDLLQVVKTPDNRIFAPADVPTRFRPEVMQDIQHWLQTQGHRIIHLHGALDPWSASAIQPGPGVDAICLKKKGACHSVRIRHLSPEEKQRIGAALERWLDVKLTHDEK